MTANQQAPHSYHGRIDAAGRLTIPADLRSRQGLHSGDEVVLVSHAHGFEVKTYEQVAREAQEKFCRAASSSRDLVQELIDERRQDAALDD